MSQLALVVMAPALGLYLWLAITTLQKAREGVAWSLGIYFALVVPGIGGAILQLFAADATTLAVAKSTMFICRAGIPVALFALVMDMMGRPLRGTTIALLCVLPAVTILLAFSNSAHGLLWDAQLKTTADALVSAPEWGPWYRLAHAPYSYFLLGTMMVLFFLRLSAVSAPQRRTLVLFLLISVGPMLTGLLHSFGVGIARLWLPALSISLTSPLFLLILRDLRQRRFRPVSYRELIEQINDPVIAVDQVGRVVSINQAASVLLDASGGQLLGRPLPADAAFANKLLGARGTSDPIEHQGRFFDIRFSDVLSSHGDLRGRTMVCRDVTSEHQAREQLATSEQLMRTIVEQSSHGIVRLHRSGHDGGTPTYICVFANEAASTLAGVEPSQLDGLDARLMLRQLLRDWVGDGCEQLIDYVLVSAAAGLPVDKELELCDANGDSNWLRMVAEPVDDDVAITLSNITAAMRRQLDTERRASHDALTGLLNREGFAAAAETVVGGHETGSLLFLDLNDFKQVNDTLGHQFGDVLLTQVASRLSQVCRPVDVIARFGGDEFVIMAGGLGEAAESDLAQRVAETLSRPYQLHEQSVECRPAIGRARFPADGSTVEQLIGRADAAMYRRKRQMREPNATNSIADFDGSS